MATPTGKASKLRQVQIGKETTWGTAVAATTKLALISEATFKPNIETKTAEEIGTLSPATNADVVFTGGGTIELKGTLTYEQAVLFYQSMLGPVTPTGAGPYSRIHLAPHRSSYNPTSYTFEYGMSGALYKAVGGVLTKFEVTAEKRDFVMFSAEFAVKSVSTLSSLAALSEPTATIIRSRDLTAYLDPTSGTALSTALTATVISAKVTVETRNHMKDYIGSIDAEGFGIDQFQGSAEFKLEFLSAVKAEVDAMLAAATVNRFFGLESSRGTQSDVWIMAGIWDSSDMTLFDDENGNLSVTLKVLPQYNSALGSWLEIDNTNTIASI